MSSNWSEFLVNKGATMSDGSVVDFGDTLSELSAAANGNVISDLSHLDRLVVQGADAESFLLSQLSNDIRQLDETHAQLSTYCNPKGRMLGLFLIFSEKENFVLVSDPTIGTSLVPRLKMFVMRSRVEISDYSGQRVFIGVSGPDAKTKLSAMFDQVMPDEPNAMWQKDDLTIIRLRGHIPRYMISGNPENIITIWGELGSVVTAAGRAAWEWLDIASGFPSINPDTSEQFIPQMLNLDILDAVNFKKGCYPGQEIIARMKYLGKLKQRMFLGHARESTPAPGDSIFASSFGNQSAGTVVNARPAPGGGCDLLIVAQIKAATEDTLHLVSPDGATIELKKLPYQVSLEGKNEDQNS